MTEEQKPPCFQDGAQQVVSNAMVLRLQQEERVGDADGHYQSEANRYLKL